MNNISRLLEWFQVMLRSFGQIGDFMTRSFININGVSLNVLTLLTATGLTAYLVLAFTFWIIK